jgi:hypothetical protein
MAGTRSKALREGLDIRNKDRAMDTRSKAQVDSSRGRRLPTGSSRLMHHSLFRRN